MERFAATENHDATSMLPRSIGHLSASAVRQVRIQTEPNGKYTPGYMKDILSMEMKTRIFFRWVNSRTGLINPKLYFFFKDALPPVSHLVRDGSEEQFAYMKQNMQEKCLFAAASRPDLLEFLVLVLVLSWVVRLGLEEYPIQILVKKLFPTNSLSSF